MLTPKLHHLCFILFLGRCACVGVSAHPHLLECCMYGLQVANVANDWYMSLCAGVGSHPL